ncbi:MAG: DUF1987 domain-containing protein [Bacteroidetes bacterium]|nr:DUF1987 domain-containing protein [Bacteroidota bacterium]
MPAPLAIPATDKTPQVLFDTQAGLLRMEGCSIHENAEAFFQPLMRNVEAYVRNPAPHTAVHIGLTYFNSSSSKYLLDLLKLFDDLNAARPGTVEVVWHYEPDDLDMEEAGEDYRALLDLPVRLEPGTIG